MPLRDLVRIIGSYNPGTEMPELETLRAHPQLYSNSVPLAILTS
jgi:hypothetical protein